MIIDPFRPTDVFPRPLVLEWDAARYQPNYLRLPGTEAQLQQSIIDILTARGVTIWAADAGAKQLRGRAIAQLKKAGVAKPDRLLRGKTGVKAGMSDLPGVLNPSGRAIYIEVKKPAFLGVRGQVLSAAGVPTDDERAFLLAVHAAGAAAGVAWSVRDALWIVGLE